MSDERELFEADYSRGYTRSTHQDGTVEFRGFLIPTAIDYEAIKVITTRAVRLGNDKAAYNSGMDKDEIESDGEDFADDIMAILGKEEQ